MGSLLRASYFDAVGRIGLMRQADISIPTGSEAIPDYTDFHRQLPFLKLDYAASAIDVSI
jgi:hypothetical protein